MKKTIFAAVAALCLMAGEAVFAQTESAPAPAAAPKERPTLEQIAQRKTDRMAERLEFTDAQKKQVYEINLQQLKEMEAQREAMRKAREARAEQMKSILSTEQFVKWAQMQQRRPRNTIGCTARRPASRVAVPPVRRPASRLPKDSVRVRAVPAPRYAPKPVSARRPTAKRPAARPVAVP